MNYKKIKKYIVPVDAKAFDNRLRFIREAIAKGEEDREDFRCYECLQYIPPTHKYGQCKIGRRPFGMRGSDIHTCSDAARALLRGKCWKCGKNEPLNKILIERGNFTDNRTLLVCQACEKEIDELDKQMSKYEGYNEQKNRT